MIRRLGRVGVLGDIHAEDDSLFAALAYLRGLELDAILAVGDIVDGLGDCDRAVRLLRDRGVLAVRGNHERWFLAGTMRDFPDATESLTDANRAWLAELPATRRFETEAGPLMLCHGIADDDMAVLKSDTDEYSLAWLEPLHQLIADRSVALMIGGHTHQRMVRAFDGLMVINAGTLHRSFAAGFAVVDFLSNDVQFVDVRDGACVEAERLSLGPRVTESK